MDPGDASTSSATLDNSSTVLSKIASLYAERLMSDVILVVGGSEFPCHRLILCASSDVFQIMLMNPNWNESREKRIVLGETPSCEAVFEDFLKYLYTGKIALDFATVIPIVSLADKYNVTDLLRIGLDYMSVNIATACQKSQLVSWWQFAVSSSNILTHKIDQLCFNFIKANFEAVTHCSDFSIMELDLLVSLVRSNDLVVADEMLLFRCVDHWMTARRDFFSKNCDDLESILADMNANVLALIPNVRFPMMTPAQLADLLLNPLAQSHMELLVENIRVAMTYHKNQLSPVQRSQLDSRLFTPRLYTAKQFCETLCVEHLSNLQAYHCRSLIFGCQRQEPANSSKEEDDQQSEWVVNVYPKGVWFQRCLTVYRPPGLEVPERVLRTVRVSVASNEQERQEGSRVRIGILVCGSQDGFEHVRRVTTRNYIFTENDQIVNFDSEELFDELNQSAESESEEERDHRHMFHGAGRRRRRSHSGQDRKRRRRPRSNSHFLVGDDKDCFKLRVVIAPLNQLSSLDTS